MNQETDELYKWIDSHSITRPKRNLNRDFSDAVPLAEIMKQHFPKMVDLHNYYPKNSYSQKLINWEVLNKRVLNKIKINLTASEMEQLAKGTAGAIEKLLGTLKEKLDKLTGAGDGQEEEGKVYYFEDKDLSARDGIVPVKVKSGTKTLDKKMVASEVFDKMEKDLVEKDETIISLKGRVEHLENLIKLKDDRIKDLTNQLQSIANSASEVNLSPKSRFFNKIF